MTCFHAFSNSRDIFYFTTWYSYRYGDMWTSINCSYLPLYDVSSCDPNSLNTVILKWVYKSQHSFLSYLDIILLQNLINRRIFNIDIKLDTFTGWGFYKSNQMENSSTMHNPRIIYKFYKFIYCVWNVWSCATRNI